MSRPIREAMCVIGGLSYRSYPRCRGHAHRLPAAPGAMDQTVRTAIEGEKPLRCKERRGRRSQEDSCTGLTLDGVGTPTGCRLCRESWIRLSGRPSRERSPCGARSGEGEGHRCTLVPVLPSMPWARPQAAGCAGSHGSDCQDGHRGAEVIAVQGAEREKVTGGLLYRSYPRCRPWPSPAE